MKIIIFGTGKTAIFYLRRLRKGIEVIAISDNYYANDKFLNYQFVKPDRLIDYHFDYVIIASIYDEEIYPQLLSLGIADQKILRIQDQKHNVFDCSYAYQSYMDALFSNEVKDFELNGNGTEALITGISYHKYGINAKLLTKKTYNFAFPSQDLFYDFEVIKYLYNSYEENLRKVSYVIIGLSYISFEYDLSKSKNSFEVLRYFPYISNPHNLIETRHYEKYVKEYKRNINTYQLLHSIFDSSLATDISAEIALSDAESDYNKNYPITVAENKWILEEYIHFLEDKNIKPIILIMPVTSYYSQCCPPKVVSKFYKNLYDVIGCQNKYQILDYFNTKNYEDNCWFHVNHLNEKGAERFTKELEADIWQ